MIKIPNHSGSVFHPTFLKGSVAMRVEMLPKQQFKPGEQVAATVFVVIGTVSPVGDYAGPPICIVETPSGIDAIPESELKGIR